MKKRLAVLLSGGAVVLAACSPGHGARPSLVAGDSGAPSTSTSTSASSSGSEPGPSSAAPPTTPQPTSLVKPPAVQPPPATGTPAPAGTPGWLLTAGNTGLAAHGLSCDSLPLYKGGDAPPAGAVISGVRIETSLTLFAGDITIEKSCVRPNQLNEGSHIVTTNGPCEDSCQVTGSPVTIRDSEIDGSKLSATTIAKSCAFLGVATLQRNYVHGMGSGICFFNTGKTLDAVAEGNYVTKLRAGGDSHNDGATVRDFPTGSNPERRLVFRNNRIDCSTGNDTGAMFIQTYGGDIDNVTLEGNLLEGGGYNLGLEAGFGNKYGRNMRAVDNRFNSTGWGASYVTDKGLGYKWAEWRDNFANNPGVAENEGQAVSP
ncbi:hypothetical protein [Umezawaea sp.]|uniref:hypothetical protein n=1 Tax=Umezawaea sp. TaxID=1955258 RepID=UPI002ED599C8